MKIRRTLLLLILATGSLTALAQPTQRHSPSIATNTLLTIIRYEDQRNWNDDLKRMLSDADARVRRRAALATGRIGDERAVASLAETLLSDRDRDVRQMAAFALGEIESPGGAYALTQILKSRGDEVADSETRARAVEALGKIAGAMISAAPPVASGAPKPPEDSRLGIIRAAIVDSLQFEDSRRSRPDKLTILLGLTAVLRARPEGAGPLVARFLDYSDPEIVAATLNTMARLRLKDNNEGVRKLLSHGDPIVRANAARVIGAAEHKEAFDAVLDRALHDPDVRVRASAIRALASLKDARAAAPLIKRGYDLLTAERENPSARNEHLEIATTLGRLLPNSANAEAIDLLKAMHARTKGEAVEVETAFARIAPGIYLTNPSEDKSLIVGSNWRQISRRAQGLAAISEVVSGAATGSAGDNLLQAAEKELASMLDRRTTPALAIPDVLQAYNTLKGRDSIQYASKFLQANDVIVRATAAEILGAGPSEANTRALAAALPRALSDRDLNDAALAILEALGKQKNAAANDAIKSALNSSDHLIRRRAVALLKANGVGEFSDRIGLAKTRYTPADYRRAIARIGRKTTATVVTSQGSFTIEFLPEDAPLTVDNFVQLAKRGFFNGQTVPRVVPNFVVQAGDPRGDQNGGPGYQIRCEINEVPYERAAVGMALSGKDTGGSQWFVTHSPQPHLDGGYTVFGRVTRGMEVVDKIARGALIRRVIVSER